MILGKFFLLVEPLSVAFRLDPAPTTLYVNGYGFAVPEASENSSARPF